MPSHLLCYHTWASFVVTLLHIYFKLFCLCEFGCIPSWVLLVCISKKTLSSNMIKLVYCKIMIIRVHLALYFYLNYLCCIPASCSIYYPCDWLKHNNIYCYVFRFPFSQWATHDGFDLLWTVPLQLRLLSSADRQSRWRQKAAPLTSAECCCAGRCCAGAGTVSGCACCGSRWPWPLPLRWSWCCTLPTIWARHTSCEYRMDVCLAETEEKYVEDVRFLFNS